MAPDLGNFWWVPIAAAAIGGFLVPIIGYYRRPRNGQHSQSTFHGTAMFDASVAKDLLAQMVELVIQTRRIADATDDLVEIERGRDKLEQRRRDAEYENAVRDNAALKRKLDEQERGKR